MSHALQVGYQTFENEVLNSSVPVIVDFYADWCGPCRMLSPILDEIAIEYQGKAKVVKVNVDDEPELAGHFNVSSIPALMFIRDGHLVGQSAGMMSKGALKQALNKLVG